MNEWAADKSGFFSPVRLKRRCRLCGSDGWLPLPVPHPDRSVLSDGTVVAEPLRKCTCIACGLLEHVTPPDAENIRTYFGSTYTLGDNESGPGFGNTASKDYAKWIVSGLGQFEPTTVLEVGCGNGSLLKELGRLLPKSSLLGIEPAARAADVARKRGLNVHDVYVLDEQSARSYTADLVTSVNVIEHTPDPVRFLEAIKEAVVDDGLVVTICPNGSIATSEILFFDHFHSLCMGNMPRLLRASGLTLVDYTRSPMPLHGFHMAIAVKGNHAPIGYRQPFVPGKTDVRALHENRVAYLNNWGELDTQLCKLMADYRAVAVFGIGETAHLIRAYAPTAWQRIENFVVDDPKISSFFGVPVVPFDNFYPSQDRIVLLAVAPRSAPTVSARLKAAGHAVYALETETRAEILNAGRQ